MHIWLYCIVLVTSMTWAETIEVAIDEAEVMRLFETEYDKQRFEEAKKTGRIEGYQTYLSGCTKPYCAFAADAQRAYFAFIKDQATVAIYDSFFNYCPSDCVIYEEAKPLYDQRLAEENYEAKIYALALQYKNAEAYRAYLKVCRLCLNRADIQNRLGE